MGRYIKKTKPNEPTVKGTIYDGHCANGKEKPPNYTTGRPTKYKPEYCQMLIDWMREGRSFYTFATVVEVNQDTLAEWVNVHIDFSDAKKRGRDLEMKWWDDLHRRCAATGQGNITAIVWAQKNKFPKHYKERPCKENKYEVLLKKV